ncbi:MAG TPA: DUF885 domain-containing protein [Thermoanaerobaculia bacterium]|nr:DUF885 domain-containing protein [Thermoanaerobaculia bacterium]
MPAVLLDQDGRRRALALLGLFAAVLSASGAGAASAQRTSSPMSAARVAGAASAAPAGSAAEEAARELHALFDETWELALREDPLLATSVGDNRYDDRLPSMTAADLARRVELARRALARLHAIDRSGLDATDRISYQLFERQLADQLSEDQFKSYLMPISAEGGFHSDFARLPAEMPFAAVKDYENYIARLRAFPAYMQQQTALLRQGLSAAMTLPKVVLAGFDFTITTHLVSDPARGVFWKPFEKFPATVAASEQERLRAAGRAAIVESVLPAYRALLDFMSHDYVPGARQTVGASALPNGRDYYAYLVRHFTTLDITPEEIHQVGLREVERIRAEMAAVIKQVGFAKSFAEFLEFLRTDPRFYAKTPDELLKAAAYIAKRMDGKLPALFKTLPRQPYGIAPVPEDLAPKYTGGRYNGAPIDSRRAGTYWVNTYALNSRPLYTLEALTLHEAVPGHHLQGALAQEATGLPIFRRYTYVDAYGEGWGLYSEWLGLEAGFYTDPYSNFGRLTYEMWRACRLVVDTGLHAQGWTRQQAMDFLAANTALSRHEIETETDRYIGWPGQALAYKMGEIKIKQLRRQAEEALGERFDVRDFHDVILRGGAVTLPILEELVRDYIRAASAPRAGSSASPPAPAEVSRRKR